MTDATQGPGTADKDTAAPERIWAWPKAGHVYGTWSVTTTFGGTEYRRADALAAALARVEKLEGVANALLAAATELAQYASYAEIVGGVSVNRAPIRRYCDEIFALRKTLPKDENFEPSFSALKGGAA